MLLQKLYRWPYLLLFFAALFWAGNAVGGKIAVGHISPFLLTSLRWMLATLLLLPIAWKHIKADWHIAAPNLAFLLLLGAIGFTAFNNVMYLALAHTTAINSALIQSAMPLFIFLLNFLFFRVRASRYQMIGFPITLLGVMIIAVQGHWNVLMSLQFNFGDMLMILATLFYAVYSVLLKNKPSLHWLSLMLVLSCSALFASLPFTLYEVAAEKVIWPDLTGVAVVFYTAVFASLMAQTFWIRGVELVGSNAASLFINLVPLIASLLALTILGEQIHVYHVIGMVLIIGGVFFAQKHAPSV